MTYRYKTDPIGKQAEVISEHWHRPAHALLCRPGTGKSKMAIDHAGMLHYHGRLTTLVVVAPNNVHRQWVDEAIPTHLSPDVPWIGGAYSSGMGKRALDQLQRSFRSTTPALRVLTLSFQGLQTTAGHRLAGEVVKDRSGSTMVVVDESHQVSNTKAAGYRAVLNLTRAARYRRIATGTLLRQNPFSAFGQFEFLGPGLLGGITKLSVFKSTFAEMLPPTHGLVRKVAKDFQEKTGRTIIPQIQARDENDRPIYRNLAYLRRLLEPWSSFLSLADVNGSEPRILSSTRPVELTPQQRALYDQIQDVGIAESPGGLLTVDGTLALSLRLAQVVGGFCPSDDDPKAQAIEGGNPKVDEVVAVIDELGPDEKLIIWCRFHAEIDAVVERLAVAYGPPSVVQYHGRVTGSDRSDAKRRFREDPSCRFFVGQPKAGGTGLDGLQSMCNYMVFYSNEYPYLDREQAVARLARTGGHLTVNVIDIKAEGTIDDDIVRCMQTAEDVTIEVLRAGVGRRVRVD